jgi:hypothetical protein
MALHGLPASVSPEDRRVALELEREAITAALELLMVPPVILEPPMTKIEREAAAVAAASFRPESELPRRPRNRSIVTSVEPMPEPEPEPEPIDVAELLARIAREGEERRARRLGLVTA